MQHPTEFRIASVLKRTCFVLGRISPKVAAVSAITALPGLLLLSLGGRLVARPVLDQVFPPIFLLSLIFGQGVVLYIAFQGMLGTLVSLPDAFKIGFRRYLPLFATVFCMGCVVGVIQASVAAVVPLATPGLARFLFIVPAVTIIILFPIWSVAIPASVLERLGPLRSFGRSRALTRGHRFKMMVLLFVAVVTALTLRAGVMVTADMIAKLGPTYILLPILGVSVILNVIWLSFLAVLLAVAYHDLRLAKDGSIDPTAAVFD